MAEIDCPAAVTAVGWRGGRSRDGAEWWRRRPGGGGSAQPIRTLRSFGANYYYCVHRTLSGRSMAFPYIISDPLKSVASRSDVNNTIRRSSSSRVLTARGSDRTAALRTGTRVRPPLCRDNNNYACIIDTQVYRSFRTRASGVLLGRRWSGEAAFVSLSAPSFLRDRVSCIAKSPGKTGGWFRQRLLYADFVKSVISHDCKTVSIFLETLNPQ